MQTIETTRLLVPEISCGHCERAIVDALSPILGVQSVTIDIPMKHVTIDYDSAVISIQFLEETLAEKDYPVTRILDAATPSASRRLPVVASIGCSCCAPSGQH